MLMRKASLLTHLSHRGSDGAHSLFSCWCCFVVTPALMLGFLCVRLSPWTMDHSSECPYRVCQSEVSYACVHRRGERPPPLQHMVPRLNNKMNVSWIQPGTEAPQSARVAWRTDWMNRIENRITDKSEERRERKKRVEWTRGHKRERFSWIISTLNSATVAVL